VGNAAPPNENMGPIIYRKLLELEMEILHTFYYVQVHFPEMKFFPLGACVGRSAPSCKFGTPSDPGNY